MQAIDSKTYCDRHFPNGLPNVTERQHYVPVRYLMPWSTEHRIAMRRNHTAPKMVGVRDVAVRRWFYEFAELNFVELKTILDVINANAPDLYERRAFTLFFAASIVPQIAGRLFANKNDQEALEMLGLLTTNGLYDENSERCFMIKELATKKNPDVAIKGFEMIRRNGSEGILCGMENAAWPYIDKILAGNVKFLQSRSDVVHLIEYIFLQMFRTVKLGQTLTSEAKKYSDMSSDFAKSMIPYLQMVFAIQMSHKVMKQLDRHELIVLPNNTGINLITSDYPFTHMSDRLHCDFLFPISPKNIIYLGSQGSLEDKYSFLSTLDLGVARGLNEKIVTNSVEQVFATSTDELMGLPMLNKKNERNHDNET